MLLTPAALLVVGVMCVIGVFASDSQSHRVLIQNDEHSFHAVLTHPLVPMEYHLYRKRGMEIKCHDDHLVRYVDAKMQAEVWNFSQGRVSKFQLLNNNSGVFISHTTDQFRPLERWIDSAELSEFILGDFAAKVIIFGHHLHEQHPVTQQSGGFFLQKMAERFLTMKKTHMEMLMKNASKIPPLKYSPETSYWRIAGSYVKCLLAGVAVARPNNYGNSCTCCKNNCFGMCGPGCCCWPGICGTCQCRDGCWDHDYWCSCSGFFTPACFFDHPVSKVAHALVAQNIQVMYNDMKAYVSDCTGTSKCGSYSDGSCLTEPSDGCVV